MAINRQRKVFAGLLVLAVGALILDRGVLAPAGASAGLLPATEPAIDGPAAPTSGAPAPMSALTSAIAQRVQSVVAERLSVGPLPEGGGPLDLSAVLGRATQDTVRAPAGGPPDAMETAEAATEAPPRPAANNTPTLSAAMPSRSGGMAIFDGRPVRAGQPIGDSGWTLRSVRRDGVEIVRDGRVRLLRLPNYSDHAAPAGGG